MKNMQKFASTQKNQLSLGYEFEKAQNRKREDSLFIIGLHTFKRINE